jgi:hypothetical protein
MNCVKNVSTFNQFKALGRFALEAGSEVAFLLDLQNRM